MRARPRFRVGLTFRVELQHLLTLCLGQVRIFKIVIHCFRCIIVIIPALRRHHISMARDIRYYYYLFFFMYNRF